MQRGAQFRERRRAAKIATCLRPFGRYGLVAAYGTLTSEGPPWPTSRAVTFSTASRSRSAAGLTAEAQVFDAQVSAQRGRYPPALTGLRGQHPGSFETAHAQARNRSRFATDGLAVEERYDLVVVGAGISGLAAAWFYRRAAGPSARILVLDNHDDFGGHAKRNEFMLDGRLLIGYGGSESIDSPRTQYSDIAKALLRDLGVAVERFETAFERTLYSSLGLSRGTFFAREAFGRDVLVAGEPPKVTPTRSRGALPMEAASRIRGRLSDLRCEQGAVARALRRGARSARGQERRAEARAAQGHELPRLPHEVVRLQRGGGELLPGPHARLLRAGMRRGAGRGCARPRLSRLRRSRAAGRVPARESPTSIISPTATPRSPDCWCVRSSRMRRPAAPWTT